MNKRFVKLGSLILIVITAASLYAALTNSRGSSFRNQPFEGPSLAHLLGTDDVGHDVLVNLLQGGKTSLLVGIVVGVLATIFGLVVGGLAGYLKGLDAPLMKAVDMFMVIPRLPMIIFLSLFLRPSLWNVISILTIFGWPMAARTVRPLVIGLRNSEFITAARSIGGGNWYILRRHIFPHLYSICAVQFVLEARQAVLAEAGLGFLGLEDPTTKSWGMMLSYAFNHEATFISDAWYWTVLPPAIMLSLFVLSLSLIAVGLESSFNPRLRNHMNTITKKLVITSSEVQ